MHIIHVGKSGGKNLILKFRKNYKLHFNHIHVGENRNLREEILLRDPCKRIKQLTN